MNTNHILKVSDLSVSYGANRIINNMNFEINCGELTAIIGNNGCGKSTLLKAVMNLIKHSGNCYIRDNNDASAKYLSLENMSVKKKAAFISYIPQRIGITMDMSVLDVCLMGYNSKLNFLASPNTGMKKNVITALNTVGLSGIEERNFLSLSEGQKQLCILARTLIEDSYLMLLDEPDSALDFSNKYRLMRKIKSFINKQKAALVCIHDPALALNLCDRLLLMKEGCIICEIIPATDSIEEINNKMSLIFDNIYISKCNDYNGLSHICVMSY